MATIYTLESGVPYIKTRTEQGWTADFVFNREGFPWLSGSTFYYWGISGETVDYNYADNNLSFQFTPDGRIRWVAIHYYPQEEVLNETNIYPIVSGQTPVLCSGGTSNDFNITITFKRYLDLVDCDIENAGGVNDLVSSTGLTISNGLDYTNWLTGATLQYSAIETLNKKWYSKRNNRLGTLKIYLNGNPIYKLENFEEIIPTQRQSTNPLVQSWGQGTDGIMEVHSGSTQFNMLNIEYYEEPIDAISVKNHYLTLIKPNFNINECGTPCNENVSGNSLTPTPTPTPSITPTSTVTPTPTPSVTATSTGTPTPTPTSSVGFVPSPTPTPSITPTNTITPTVTPTPTLTNTPTPSTPVQTFVGYPYTLQCSPSAIGTGKLFLFSNTGFSNITFDPVLALNGGIIFDHSDNTSTDQTSFYSSITGNTQLQLTQNSNVATYSVSTGGFVLNQGGEPFYIYSASQSSGLVTLISQVGGAFTCGQPITVSILKP